MNKIATNFTLFLLALALLVVLQTRPAPANVFAAQVKISNPDDSPFDGSFTDGTHAKISFFLNDDASAVTVEIVDANSGSTVAQIDGGAMSRGLNSVEWDGTGAVTNGQYLLRVTAEQPNASETEWTLFFDSGDIDIFTRGVAVVTEQSDPNFGLIFTSNDGGPLGTGINIYNPDGSFHDPFLVAADVTSGGTVNYGSDAPLFAALDWQGRLWVSLKDNGEVMRINRDFSTQVVISGLSFPTGLFLEGRGDDFTLYVAANNQVLRGNIGTADVFDAANMEVVAEFSTFFPRQIMLDDDGAMYVTLRASAADLGSEGRGIRKYDISGTLPVTDNDALWFLGEDKTFIANDLLLDRGADPNTSTDDILYYCTRAGSANDQDGIWRIDDLNSFFPDTVRIMTEETFYNGDISANVNARATLDFDAAGNIIFMENSNEHVFFISPPGEGPTNSFTTTGPDTVLVLDSPVGIEDEEEFLPRAYRLKANYPNPFNPATHIEFSVPEFGFVALQVYDVSGRLVQTLVSENKAPGTYTVTWHGRDAQGHEVASGVYLVRMQAGDFVQTRRMTLLR